MTAAKPPSPRFAIIRAKDATDFEESGLMTSAMPTEVEMAGSIAAIDAGVMDGTNVKLLFEMPGMSLAHAWFKSAFPLPRHSHNADCLYYILGGSLKLGTEVLGKGDGFFVGAGVPYTYVPCEDGVQLLEFRTTNSFDIKMFANNPAFWEKAETTVRAKQSEWTSESEPPEG